MDLSTKFENYVIGNKINVITENGFPKQYPLHWHKYIEIIAYPEIAKNDSVAVIQIDNTEYTLHSGDILFVWSGELHSIVQNPDGLLLGIQFSPSILYELSDFSPYIHHLKTIHKLSYDEYPEVLQALHLYSSQIRNLEKKNSKFPGVEKLILLLEFFMTLSSFAKEKSSDEYDLSSAYPADTLQKIQDSCIYLSENCEKDISLSSVAGLAGFSPAYFSRIFKKITSFSFVEYLTLQRIKAAQILLADFHIPITEIAYQCGFSSISTFNRVFRQYLGCSPSEYRKLYDTRYSK